MEDARKKVILSAIMLSLTIQLCACSKEEAISTGPKPEKNISSGKIPELRQEVYSFRVEGFGRGNNRVRWGLEGASASVISDKININELKAVYYGEDMTFTVFADKAIYDKKTQDIELTENIVGNTSDGGQLHTAYAKWSAATEEIATDSYVTVKRDNILCCGKGMTTRPRLKRVRFSREVEVTIAPDKKITCDGPFDIDHEKNLAIFNNNVKITDEESETLTDKLTVFLNPQTHEIDRVVTEGNVEVRHRGDIEDIAEMSF